MRRTALVVFLFSQTTAALAQFPSFNSYSISRISQVVFSSSKPADKKRNKTEIPPWIIPGGYRSYFFVDGNDTYIWSARSSMSDHTSINLDNAVGPNQASISYIHDRDFDPRDNRENWKRNYHAIYSAQYINHPVFGPISIGFLHGENKNQVAGEKRYQNTIQPNVPIDLNDPDSYSGGQPYHDGWKAYNAMISAAWIPNSRQTNWGQQFFRNDMGPIAWPSTGYVTPGGKKCTSGLRHPSSIVCGNYIYVFYADGGPFGNNIGQEDGRTEGIKVVRARIADALDPHSYSIYYRDPSGMETWLPSLPDGFNRDEMLNYVAVKGPKSTDIMDDRRNVYQEVRFSVAKVRNMDYFLGVEEYIDVTDAKKYKVALRFSDDLVHWTKRALIVTVADNWEATRMNYPIFLSNDGWSNTEIDINDFYILGTETEPGNSVNRIHISKLGIPTNQVASLMAYAAPVNSGNTIFPNPTSGTFQLAYTLDVASKVRIDLFDALGKRLGTIDNDLREQGKYVDQYDITNYPPGLYFVEIFSNGRRKTFKLLKN